LDRDIRHEFHFSIDGRKVGKVAGFNCLFVDLQAGSCEVSAGTGGLPKKHLTLNLVPGEMRYVQVEWIVSMSLKRYLLGPLAESPIRLIIMDPDQAPQDLNRCFYVGSDLSGLSTRE
jgi:hypothetical protein